MNEYTNTTTNGSSCSYSNLGAYNNSGDIVIPVGARFIPGSLVPSFGGLGYNSRGYNVRLGPSRENYSGAPCGDYYSIKNAYPSECGWPDEYMYRSC